MASIVTSAFGRYLLVGSAATTIHYVLLVALVELSGSTAAPAAAFGAACGGIAAYAGTRRFTFPGRVPHAQALPRFMAVAAFGVAANGAIVWSATAIAGMHYLAAQVIATLFVLWSGFMLNRRWSFA
ncbi:MAG TPA: GtrA family protein [Steroidobacteraceae bacterium]|nr:GtrA family protein [Steroidobacteraceae bacterium]